MFLYIYEVKKRLKLEIDSKSRYFLSKTSYRYYKKKINWKSIRSEINTDKEMISFLHSHRMIGKVQFW